MRSSLCEKFGVKYDIKKYDEMLVRSFDCVEKNDKETTLALQTSRDLVEEAEQKGLTDSDVLYDFACQRIHYISDIHLMHRIKNAGCRSKEDVIYIIQKIVASIATEAGSLLLIGGDVASDFGVFQLFVRLLAKTLCENTQVVFILGNHKLWSFPGLQIEQIVSKYRDFLDKYGMYLLQNDILYKEDRGLVSEPGSGVYLIRYDDLCIMDKKQLANRLQFARYIILGGMGFSGYNTEFNAEKGIYYMTMDRSTEIEESEIFERLYNRLLPILSNKNTVILTHMPKKDWCKKANPEKNMVYVSGHTHKNFFYDDGEYRIYSDNQVGYCCEHPHLKAFLIDNDYDCFFDSDDGIFKITSKQYADFYRGKNIPMSFQRKVNSLFMLKKNGWYCFIHESKEGSLTILNGGAMQKLATKDIHYYYDNMDAMISLIKEPLDKFTSFQKYVASIVRRIGGTGRIHGSIIDIDFYSHIFINPVDLSMTGYFALDMVDKIIYPSVLDLLKDRCPMIYEGYVKSLKGCTKNPLVGQTRCPQINLDLDIYKASREIRKMQKLDSNILTTWYDEVLRSKPQLDLL